MSCEITDITVSDLVRHKNRSQVMAVVYVDFILSEQGDEPLTGRTRHHVTVNVRTDAPEQRIVKRLRAQAVKSQEAFFEGDDDPGMNVFSDMCECETTSLSIDDELSLEQDLLEIEREYRSVA